MRAQAIHYETPWLATKAEGKIHLSDPEGYKTWLGQVYGDGERVMVLVLPLASDNPRFHESVYRYWRGCVLPIIADEIGEPNLDTAHDIVVAQLTGVQAAPKKRRGLKLKRKSTAMDSMPCDELCELVDRAIVWATVDLHLVIPMADRSWKWKQRRGTGHQPGAENGVLSAVGNAGGVKPSAAPSE
jgi:hypothetical protein